MANLLTRLLSWTTKMAGLGGAYYLPVSGGWLSAEAGQYWNWWQLGYDPVPATACSAMVEACVSAYSQTVAMLPGNHWRANDRGGRDRITSSALSRILRQPNSYQSISDFLLNATRSLYLDGNCFALALRNDRFEISELHLMSPRQCGAQIAVTGDVFYALGGNEIIERRLPDQPLIVPQRDVLHIKLHTTRSQLKGESPLTAALLDLAATGAISRQQIAYYTNQARPSTILSSDLVFTKAQADELRERWNEQARGLNAGGTPILGGGLKPFTLTGTPKDAEMADFMKLSEQHIALAYRIPLQLLGIGETPFASTEALMQFWLASGLGFALAHIEDAFGALYGLRGYPEEYVELDTTALLRSAEKDRMEGLATSIRGGIRTINEARATEGLSRVEGGDDIRVQAQDVPLDWHEQQAEQQSQESAQPEPSPGEPPEERDYEHLRHGFRASHGRHLDLAV